MWFWNRKKDKKKEDVVISSHCYAKLPTSHRQYFSPVPGSTAAVNVTHEVRSDSDNGFGIFMLAQMEANNAAIGYLASDDLAGHAPSDFGGFEGGDTGGGGASGSWDSSPSLSLSMTGCASRSAF